MHCNLQYMSLLIMRIEESSVPFTNFQNTHITKGGAFHKAPLGCSPGRMIKKKTKKNSGESNLFRVIKVAATKLLFFAIANHMFTIVGDDASYLKSFTTSLIMLGPRQTMYILISGDRLPGRYYTAA